MRRFLLFPALLIPLIASVIVSQSTVKNPHGELQWDCQDCHTTESWTKMRDSLAFDHDATGFHLVGAHAAANCSGCHKEMVFSHVGTACVDCHADHHNGQLGVECQNCHIPRDWQNRQNNLEVHSARGFALTGAHAVADCEACHRGHSRQEYAGTAVDCYGCHAEAYAATEEPNHAMAGFPIDCQTCHEAASASWRFADFNHPAAFPLSGGHQGVACKDCHGTGYAGTPTDCYSCHSADFASTTDPNHETSGFTHDCTLCHTIAGWEPANYDHANTGFPLTGAHRQVQCVACHATQYAGTPAACYSCHETDFAGTAEPDHELAQFDHDCTQCHTTTNWESSFDHASTGFVLTGQHIALACSQCHGTAFSGTPTGCYSCHQSDFETVSEPNHVSQGFSHECTTCHTTNGWTPSSFNHANTAFPLTGKHVDASCTACHTSGYAGTPTDCYSCHQTDFESTGDPNHVLAGFSHTCTDCHTTSGWETTSFDHSTTGFALSGAHTTLTCVTCHATSYAGTPSACYACHQSAYEQVTSPNHVTNNFDQNCTSCHTTTAWSPANFDHNATAFPLTGAHLQATCISCHATQYAGTPTACYSCHQTDFAGTTEPDHELAAFSHDCTQCHTTNNWESSFDHASTGFALTGQHMVTVCSQCHATAFAGTPTGCYDCHQSDFNAVLDPNHVSNNFDHNCHSCHTTSAWLPATFDHTTTAFPLTGQHATLTCISCHATQYSGTPSACFACHQTAYEGTTDPNHTAAAFPTTCQSCHTTNGWTPSNWDHDGQYFPIYSGTHAGRWSTCADCHVSPSSYAVFECTNCHEHNKTDTDDDHTQVSGYQYLSTACYNCHPRGTH